METEQSTYKTECHIGDNSILIIWDVETLDDGRDIYKIYEKSDGFSLTFQDVNECRLLYQGACEYDTADFVEKYLKEEIKKDEPSQIFIQNYYSDVFGDTDCPLVYFFDDYIKEMADEIVWDAEGFYTEEEGGEDFLDLIKWIGIGKSEAYVRSEEELMDAHRDKLLNKMIAGKPFTKWDGEKINVVLSPREYWAGKKQNY